jgi:hypothetical protein
MFVEKEFAAYFEFGFIYLSAESVIIFINLAEKLAALVL